MHGCAIKTVIEIRKRFGAGNANLNNQSARVRESERRNNQFIRARLAPKTGGISCCYSIVRRRENNEWAPQQFVGMQGQKQQH